MKAQKMIKRLEKLKQIKNRLKDEAKIRVKDTKEREDVLKERSESLGDSWGTNVNRFKARSISGTFTPEELWQLRSGIDSIEEEIRSIESAMEATRKELDLLQEDLIGKNKETRLVEALLEVRKCEQRRERLSSEQKELDDMVCLKFVK
ncbi:MAG: hypothetical protein STSR0007_12410 [Thermovirga sp.]